MLACRRKDLSSLRAGTIAYISQPSCSLVPPKEEKGKTLASGEERALLDPRPGWTLLPLATAPPYLGERGESKSSWAVNTHPGMLELQLCQLNEILPERGDPTRLEVHELCREAKRSKGKGGCLLVMPAFGAHPVWRSQRGARSAGSTAVGGSLLAAPPGS